MKSRYLFIPAIIALTIFHSYHLQSAETSLKKLPPVVIRTYPVSGHDSVDPGTTRIFVSFNKKMMDRSWSYIMQNKDSFPELVGDPSFDKTKKTCILNVKLKPDTTYVIWLNSQKIQNFKDTEGNSAVPYLLAFKTAGIDFMNKKKAAVNSTVKWLKLLEDGKYTETWKTAAVFFQSRVPEAAWTKQIAAIEKSLGKPVSRKIKSINYTKKLPGAPDGEYFVIRYSTSFKNKQSVETITPFLDKDGKWKISGYYIK